MAYLDMFWPKFSLGDAYFKYKPTNHTSQEL